MTAGENLGVHYLGHCPMWDLDLNNTDTHIIGLFENSCYRSLFRIINLVRRNCMNLDRQLGMHPLIQFWCRLCLLQRRLCLVQRVNCVFHYLFKQKIDRLGGKE
jgi:hypothetical protein